MNTTIHNNWKSKRENAPVVIQITNPKKESVFETVAQAMHNANWKNFITQGVDISLKPNLGWDKLIPGAISAPWVVEAVIQTIGDYVGNISIVESNQVVCNADKAAYLTGIDKICKRYDIPWVNMSKGKYVRFQLEDRLFLKDVKIPEILTQTELITIPLMKTHNKTTITGALKNQWGCLQELRHNFHPHLPIVLMDVNWFTQPRFAVMDATIGLEGNGPKSGNPKVMNMVLASGNLVGIDATAARIMNLDPMKIEHLILGSRYGFGSLNPKVKGASIADVKTQFAPAEHNLVSISEIMFRSSIFNHLIFQTPLFKFMLWSTRRYYDLWDLFIGRRIRKRIKNSGYYEQFLR